MEDRVDTGFVALYRREFDHVFRAALALAADRAVAEDAAQEAFARALARWGRLGGQPWVAGWVMVTALNLVRRSVGRPPKHRAGPPSFEAGDAGDVEALLDLRTALLALPTRQQQAFLLHHVLDLSVADAAAAMGCSQGAASG